MRFIGGGIDVTERRRIDELRERLFGIVGHDLRGPLASIQAATAALRAALPPEHVRALDLITRSAARMSRMVRQLLDFTRVRFADGMTLERGRCDLVALGREVLAELELAHPGRELRRELDASCEGYWDRDRLAQVLSNLVENALRHGAADRAVRVSIRGEGAQVRIEVHNWGRPIPTELLPILCEPFRRGAAGTRTDPASAGLGLGLYITREIVAAHGGRLEVDSTAERGTRFRVRLPREPAAPRP